jgi:hypothetical protein
LLEMFFEEKSGMIRADRDAHSAKLYTGSGFRVPCSGFVRRIESSNLEP